MGSGLLGPPHRHPIAEPISAAAPPRSIQGQQDRACGCPAVQPGDRATGHGHVHLLCQLSNICVRLGA